MKDKIVMDHVDISIIGAGVIGLAIGQKLASTDQQVIILEQHPSFGHETSSRNSEVIHAGIYYPAKTLKAIHCVQGKQLLYDYCEHYRIPHQRIGKLIVATVAEEESVLESIFNKAQTNGVTDLQWLSGKEIQMKEPHIQATSALFSPSTGIIDSHALMRSFLRKAEQQGATLAAQTQVYRVELKQNGFLVYVHSGQENFCFHTTILINAAGLHAQSVAQTIEGLDPVTIPPLYLCKGNYFTMSGKNPFKHLIYPVPEHNGTGLGIHATLDLAGQVRFGPDTEYVNELNYEVSTTHLPRYYQAIRRYYPELPDDALTPGYVGIRPKLQAPNAPVCDFIIQSEKEHKQPNLIQLFGIESPGLTASLSIANHVSQLLN